MSLIEHKLVKNYLQDLQNQICTALQQLDNAACFQEEHWEREEGGGGIARVLSDGAVFERAGINFSHIYG